MMFHLKHVLFLLKNIRKMTFKSIVWFIKVITYFMLLQRLNIKYYCKIPHYAVCLKQVLS